MKQIGFIILAMIVTRSSALSLQAKVGLPRGNQLVGWVVLGKESSILRRLEVCSFVLDSAPFFHATCASHAA
jgi:hypothetical protein